MPMTSFHLEKTYLAHFFIDLSDFFVALDVAFEALQNLYVGLISYRMGYQGETRY